MRTLLRAFERFFITVVSFIVIWYIVIQVFDRFEERFPAFVAGAGAYLITVYIIFPPLVHLTLLITRRGRIPRFTRAKDGLLADPVNIILIGTEEELTQAFAKAGWYHADPLTVATGLRMASAFLFKKEYKNAPFSLLYLFGRKQDYGFQQSIGDNPRKRHHVRFWAAHDDPNIDLTNPVYWNTHHDVDRTQSVMWVGAGTKDMGLGLTRFTYQITHRVDKNVDYEREFILTSLRNVGTISDEKYVESGEFVVGKYTSDGRIVTAKLKK